MNLETIDSVENTEMHVQYAGFWLRFAAHIIDNFIIGIFSFLVIGPLIFFMGLTAGLSNLAALNMEEVSDEDKLIILGSFMGFVMMISMMSVVINWLYYSLMESSSRQATIGKMALEIKVTDLKGNKISFLNASGRYFAKIISGLTFTIGFLMAGFTSKKQALHDIIAGCLVVKK